MIRSLRVRLILTFVLIFGAIQLVLGVIALTARESYIDTYFDDQLARRVDAIVASLPLSQSTFSDEDLSGDIGQESSSIYFRDFYLQVIGDDGQIKGRSHNLRQFRLPLDEQTMTVAQTGKRQFETLQGDAVEQVTGPMEQLRMVTTLVKRDGRKPVFVQVATSTQHLEESKSFLRQLFLIGIPAGLAAAAMASWFAADRAVRAIDEVTHLAEQTTPEKMGKRVNAKLLDGEVGEMAKNINQMLDRLEAGFAAQQRFVHDASHELKTPVSVIQSEAQVLALGVQSPAEYKKFVGSVQQEMQRLGKLIESLLMITRSDGRTMVMLSRIESINDLVVDTVGRCMPLAREYDIALRIELPMPDDMPADLPESMADGNLAIRGDSELCDAMISNLIRNALKYSPAKTTVLVKVIPETTHVRIEVGDEGDCIPQAEKEQIFNRLVRGSTSGKRQGSGLGLAIVKSVVDLHGGEITVEDGPEGSGCVFSIRLPLDLHDGAPTMAQ